MNKKLLISAFLMSFLLIGTVSASLIVSPSEPDINSGKATFDIGYDCYRQPGVYVYDCKQVEHKRSWFEKKDFRIWIGLCTWIDNEWICYYTWYRPAKI